jgi:hypothetical protein
LGLCSSQERRASQEGSVCRQTGRCQERQP